MKKKDKFRKHHTTFMKESIIMPGKVLIESDNESDFEEEWIENDISPILKDNIWV